MMGLFTGKHFCDAHGGAFTIDTAAESYFSFLFCVSVLILAGLPSTGSVFFSYGQDGTLGPVCSA